MAHVETDATGKQSGFQLLGILLLLRDNTTKLVRPRAQFNSRIHGLKCTKARRSGTFLGLVDRGGGSCDRHENRALIRPNTPGSPRNCLKLSVGSGIEDMVSNPVRRFVSLVVFCGQLGKHAA